MRKILISIFIAIVFSTLSFAQTGQGNFLLGGGFGAGFKTQQVEQPGANNTIVVSEYRSNSITFNPNIGFFLVDGFAIGLEADINNTENKDRNKNTRSTSSYYNIGPFVRYYFPVNIFLDAKVGIGNGKSYVYDKSKIFGYAIGAGYAAFLNDHVAIEPRIRYIGTNFSSVSNNDYKTKNGSLEFVIGLQIYL